MRIGYFTNTYPRATDTFIQREIKGLRERGFDVRTFSVRRAGIEHDVSPYVITEKKNTFCILPINPINIAVCNLSGFFNSPSSYISTFKLALSTAQPGLRGFLWQLFYWQEAVVLSRELRHQKIEHLHNHMGDASGTVAMLATRMASISYSITIHGPHIFFDPTHWALREKVKYSSFIACISHYCESQMMLFSEQTDWDRFNIVHCGINPEQFAYTEVKEQARKLLYTGRLAVEKGLPILFESLKLLKEQGYDYELTLVGDGEDRLYLEQLASEMGIDDRLIFTGFAGQDEVRKYLLESDIFVLPSFAEGVPVSLMEAMSCGIPVISTYVGGIAELIKSEETGLLVSPSDPIQLKDAIARYIDDYDLRNKVSRQGREKVVSDFNIDNEVDKLAQLFVKQSNKS